MSSLSQLHKALKQKNIKYLFTDYYDTIVHRTVHPNYTQRIWAKLMIRELGLNCSIDELYFTRQEAKNYLIDKLKREDVEIPYETLQSEVFRRLLTSEMISADKASDFFGLFEAMDVRSEQGVQFLNSDVLETLKAFKSEGGKIYLVSDFYGSRSLFAKLLEHHGINHLFEDVFSSAVLEKSKHKGTIYEALLKQLNIEAKDVMMIGDNERSDYKNALKSGLNAFQLPHQKQLRQNKRNNLGNDKKRLKKIILNTYKSCNKISAIPYTEYIIFYHVFVERLYELCKERSIKDLFFLSREGQYLKKLFDSYQDHYAIDGNIGIKTHYLKISRQASLQIALRSIDEESFGYLQTNYENLSLNDFFEVFKCPEDIKTEILGELREDGTKIITNFFNSPQLESLRKNTKFVSFYDNHRASNRKAFRAYIDSFDANIKSNGIHVVDIGWGGTMQESIYKFFEEELSVTGYYLGVGDIYNIQPRTLRYGLLFSLLPYVGYYDHILMANRQLYEQFSAADHGSALGYSLEAKDYTLEYHKPEEKWLYENHIQEHQAEMFQIHKALLSSLEPVCYDQTIMQGIISKLALKIGLFQSVRKLKFLNTLSEGFYQNIGTNKVGLTYEKPKIQSPVKSAIRFLLTPEKYFRYLVKLKSALFSKNQLLGRLFPFRLLYIYFSLNKFLRFRLFNKAFLLKFNFFK